ncbi:hypothetical protein [Natronorarus salvus]|uniref:hypothetical protein n=1 Tax=Natronorarus salvus TaxID=3117733 RepID=UPI002F26CDDD
MSEQDIEWVVGSASGWTDTMYVTVDIDAVYLMEIRRPTTQPSECNGWPLTR